ncbi:SDR family NAD(P)-dependent oxidoreductase [Candidatus Gottesmanbacteria bacterium]|nr:SDR family NAD(P)-dependent oxidoreductase [Candidatus Gottesmanbacteria bacterium]
MDLKDKVVLITDSSSGIGKAASLAFAKEDAKIVVNYRENKAGAEETVAEIKKLGSEAIALQADVADPNQVKKLFSETFKIYGTLDILINNAGLAKPKPFLEITAKDLVDEFQENFFLTVYCLCPPYTCKCCCPGLYSYSVLG